MTVAKFENILIYNLCIYILVYRLMYIYIYIYTVLSVNEYTPFEK